MSAYIKFPSNTIKLKRIIINSPDTDIAVISLCHCVTNLALLDSIWFKTGTGNDKRFIPTPLLPSKYGS